MFVNSLLVWSSLLSYFIIFINFLVHSFIHSFIHCYINATSTYSMIYNKFIPYTHPDRYHAGEINTVWHWTWPGLAGPVHNYSIIPATCFLPPFMTNQWYGTVHWFPSPFLFTRCIVNDKTINIVSLVHCWPIDTVCCTGWERDQSSDHS